MLLKYCCCCRDAVGEGRGADICRLGDVGDMVEDCEDIEERLLAELWKADVLEGVRRTGYGGRRCERSIRYHVT